MKHLNVEYIGQFEAQLVLELQFDQVLQAHILFQHLGPLKCYHLQDEINSIYDAGFV